MSIFATKVRYMSNVPLDNTYKDSIDFSSESAQQAYFSSLIVLSEETEMTMIKDFNYTISSSYSYAQLQNVNYIAYQNSGISTKWYYGFVTDIRYIADSCTEIDFEIDVLQTWHFDYTLKECFIERQHSLTDVAGDNILEDNLEIGEYKYQVIGTVPGFNDFRIYAAYINDDYGTDPQTYGNIYSGLKLTKGYSNAGMFEDWLGNQLTAHPDSVVSIFMFSSPSSDTYICSKRLTNIDGYVPKNNKLFTYPYNFLYVTDNEGTAANFRYEFFDTENCQFNFSTVLSPSPSNIMWPSHYNGVANTNYNEKIIIDGYPQCSWYSDAYQAYLAQNSAKITNNMIMGVTSVGIGAYTGNYGQAAGGLANIMSLLTQQHDASAMPPQARGQQNGDALFAINAKGPQFYQAFIHSDQAEAIDAFWSMFGYPMRRIAVPNRHTRPYWTYVKTIGCNLVGGIPYNHIAKIKSIYDGGITWWTNGANIGNYSLNNAPV